VLIALQRMDASGATVDETVTCWALDDGSFTVPASVWTGWATNRTLYVLVGREITSGATLPYDHSGSQVAGIYWNFGALLTQ
jgi:hypothetical protein